MRARVAGGRGGAAWVLLCLLGLHGLPCGCSRVGFPPLTKAADPTVEPDGVTVDLRRDGPAADAGADAAGDQGADSADLGADSASDLTPDTAPDVGAPDSTVQLEHAWSFQVGGPSFDSARALVADGSGNIYVAGWYYDSIDLGGGALPAEGSREIFVGSFDATGQHRWSRSFGGAGEDINGSIGLDDAGHLLLTGRFSETIDLGAGVFTSAGEGDAFIVALDRSNGAPAWALAFGGSSYDGGGVVAASGSAVWYGGYFRETIEVGGTQHVSQQDSAALLLKLAASDGEVLWSKSHGGAGSAYLSAMALAHAGDRLFVGGRFNGEASFGGATFTSAGGWDGYLASFAPADGQPQWSWRFGDTSVDSLKALGTTAAGEVIASGGFRGTVDFGGGPLLASGGAIKDDIFLLSCAGADGSHLWSQRFGGPEHDDGMALTLDAHDNIYLVGYLVGAVDFGGGPRAGDAADDLFLASFTAAGAHRFSAVYGGPYHDYGWGVAVLPSDDVVIVGEFHGTIDLGGDELVAGGGGPADSNAFFFGLTPQ